MLDAVLSMVETNDDAEFIKKLYTKYQKDMYKTAFRILRNHHDSEDAVHESFIRIINNIQAVRRIPDDKIGYYVIIVCRNVSIDLYNKKNKVKTIVLDDADYSDNEFNFDEIIDSDIGIDRIKNYILMLNETDFETLYLYLICNYSIQDIASVFNIKPTTASQRIYKAKKNLRRLMEQNDDNV